MNTLQNKVALITGGNSGIGLATAKLFRAHGAKVIITARSSDTFAKAQKELGEEFRVIQADVSKVDEIKSLISVIKKEFGRIDVLFANAGISKILPISEIDEATYDLLFDTNVKSVFYTVQQAAPILTDGGSVIINASMAAAMGFVGGSVYGATKAALQSYARHFTAEFASRKIRFNSVSPALIESPILAKAGFDEAAVKGFVEISSKNPSSRIGKTEEVAGAVLFLASANSSYVNGIDLKIDGGGSAVPLTF